MVVRYGIVAEVKGPTLRNSGSGIPDPEFRSKLILPWNDLIPTCVPWNAGNSAEYPEFRNMRTGRNRNSSRNAQPRRSSAIRERDYHFSLRLRTVSPEAINPFIGRQDPPALVGVDRASCAVETG